MRLLVRASVLVVLLAVAACEDAPPPTAPEPPAAPGIVQTLTVEAKPTSVPFGGSHIEALVTVTVLPGGQLAGLPIVALVKAEGATEPYANTYHTNADGRIRIEYFISQTTDLTFQAGSLERTVRITSGAPPAIPPSPPPTCNRAPGPCAPPPAPPPTPSLSVSVTADQATGDITTLFTFTASVTAQSGAGPATSWAWDFEDDGIVDATTADSATHTYATPGTKTVSVRVADAGGRSAGATTTVALDPPSVTAELTASPNPVVLSSTYDDDDDPGTAEVVCSVDPSIRCAVVTFQVDATPTHGAGAIAHYEWDLDGTPGFEDVTTAATSSRRVVYLGPPGILSATARAVTVDGVSSERTISVVIASALQP